MAYFLDGVFILHLNRTILADLNGLKKSFKYTKYPQIKKKCLLFEGSETVTLQE